MRYVSASERTDGDNIINASVGTGAIQGARFQRALHVQDSDPKDADPTYPWGITEPFPLVPPDGARIRVAATVIRNVPAAFLDHDVTPDQSVMTVQIEDWHRRFEATGGRILVNDEVIEYAEAHDGSTGQLLTGLKRGVGGTNPAFHSCETRVPFFVDTDFAVAFVFAHECGHGVGMAQPDHPDRKAVIIMKGGLFPGEYDGHWMSADFGADSLGEFTAW